MRTPSPVTPVVSLSPKKYQEKAWNVPKPAESIVLFLPYAHNNTFALSSKQCYDSFIALKAPLAGLRFDSCTSRLKLRSSLSFKDCWQLRRRNYSHCMATLHCHHRVSKGRQTSEEADPGLEVSCSTNQDCLPNPAQLYSLEQHAVRYAL